MKNNTSFYRKQHVVFIKTSRHFMKNNTSFYRKQHVVFIKTSRRFMKKLTSFWREKLVYTKWGTNWRCSILVKC